MTGFLFGSVVKTTTFLLSLSSPNVDKSSANTEMTASYPTFTTTSISTAKYNNLLYWLDNTFPTSYISPSLCLAPSPQGGHGAFATEDVAKDTLLLRIPRTACITNSVVLDDPDCGKAFKALIKKAGPGSETVALAGYLAKEYLIHLEGKETVFGPYFDTLPWERGINGQEHVLFWSQEDVENYLDDTMCWADSNDLRAEVKLASDLLNSIVGPWVLKARVPEAEENGKASFWDWLQPPAPTVSGPVKGLKQAVTGAFVVLLTRAFDDDFMSKKELEESAKENKDESPKEAERLIPILDMFNHSNEPSIRYSTNSEGSVEVLARRDLVKGEEIYNQYRKEEEETMPKHRFFSRFGFVPGVEKNVYELLQDKDNIFFAKRKEV